MIQRTYEQVAKCKGLDEVVIATDDSRIEENARAFGAKAIMTSASLASGTDRVLEACESMGLDRNDIVVNVQGDEPFVNPAHVEALVAAMKADATREMGTIALEWKDRVQVLSNPNIVKVVLNQASDALYFSRALVPYPRENCADNEIHLALRHLGLYAFRFHFLRAFSNLPPSMLEECEKLEQLRVLEAGHRIHVKVVKGDVEGGVDTPEQLEAAQARALSIDNEIDASGALSPSSTSS
ncbi:3-deoxy-manno-octulosonate cytidylyltransferase [Hondaea fermentalgiana]|uniref:3-deoxy-manno-octulosonate cytidylyltransferase n=1 Tax=Hondaea fermentalgiana TaxID=2315210 RepID=A0A2R5G7D5_9STRA|nr:3-deoxy-manno-octulosonate cytidylyltransferase [Hondaea fermentalgiana]|eukprot:GBG23951.1 3-deoxy-manno-octulosonate cytidylyltransferase [Hondaea fermentalgiana]